MRETPTASLVECIEGLTERIVERDEKLEAILAEVKRVHRWCVDQLPLWGEPGAEALELVAGMLEGLLVEYDGGDA